MSKLKNPTMWAARGTVAGLVFYSQHGRNLVRSLPKMYHDKQSDTQIYQRDQVFKPLTSFCRELKAYAPDLFQNNTFGRSKYAFMVHQMAPAFAGSYPTPGVNLKLAIVGNGDIPRVPLLTLVKATTSSFTATWSTALNSPMESADDIAVFCVSTPDGTKVKVITTAVARSAGTATVSVAGWFTGVSINVSEVFFISADGTKKGNAQIASALSPVNLA